MSISSITQGLPIFQPPSTNGAAAAPAATDPDHDGDVDPAGVPDNDAGHLVNIKA